MNTSPGRNPSQGTELCTVVESMFSFELDLAVLGEAWIGDRLEKIAFNPLPGAQTADQWSHQYDQQPNQVMCSLGRRDWSTNGPESNLFGLEPNYGCCTANLHQGWPEVHRGFMDGLGRWRRGRCRLRAQRGAHEDRREGRDCHRDDRLSFSQSHLAADNHPAPQRFPLHLRIPGWTQDPAISINGQKASGVTPGSYKRIDREWRDGDRVEIVFPMPVRAIQGFNGSVSVERGPLVYALGIGEHWSKLKQTGPVTDWEVFPTSPWNYGLRMDPANAATSFTVEEEPIPRQPFGSAPPVRLKAQARRLPQWVIVDDSAAPPPMSPIAIPAKEAAQTETITLIPYGAARLRITAFPVVKR